MDSIDKLQFAFSSFDFEQNGKLGHDEVCLLLRSTVKGLCKFCRIKSSEVENEPKPEEIDRITDLIFLAYNRSSFEGNEYLSVDEFQSYCSKHPIISSWLRFFSEGDVGASYPETAAPPFIHQDSDVLYADSLVATSSKASNESTVQTVTTNPILSLLQLPHISSYSSTFVTALKQKQLHQHSSHVALPWASEADKQIPEEYTAVPLNPAEDVLDPIWMHGYRGTDRRNNAHYGANGNILFFSSFICASLAKTADEDGGGAGGQWTQKLLYHHQVPISAMDVGGIGRALCVTGDYIDSRATVSLGRNYQPTNPRIVLWDTKTLSVQKAVTLYNTKGVSCLSLSSDGKRILAISMDEQSICSVYDVDTLNLIYTSVLGPQKVCDGRFAGTTSIFAVAGSGSSVGGDVAVSGATQASVLDFYVEEGASYMGADKLQVYERRAAQFQVVGKSVENVPMSALSRYEREDEMVSGNILGNVLFWRGRNCLQVVKAHSSGVTCFSFNLTHKILASGGKDGKVILYRTSLTELSSLTKQQQHRLQLSEKKGGEALRLSTRDTARQLEMWATLDLLQVDVISQHVRAVSLSKDASKVLIGVKSGELLELSCVNSGGVGEGGEEEEGGAVERVKLGEDLNKGSIIKSHWGKYRVSDRPNVAVTGLCKAPNGFASCGSDGTVRSWVEAGDGSGVHKIFKETALDSQCIAIASSGSEIAVALDSVSNPARRGVVQLMSATDLSLTLELKDSPDPIVDMKFTNDSYTFATASFSGKVYVYVGGEGSWKLKFSYGLHKAPLRYIDFSQDGRYLRSWDYIGDAVLVCDIGGTNASQEKDPEILRNLRWNSYSIPCSWDTKGVWNGLEKDDTVTCSDRSNHLVVCGRLKGSLSLTRLPATDYDPSLSASVSSSSGPSSVSNTNVVVKAHYGAVSSVLFINEGASLVTAGGEDGNILVRHL